MYFICVIIFFVLGANLEPAILVDEILLKQKEMLDTAVLVQTNSNSGSGTIIDRLDTDVENIFEYRILTNAHVVRPRFLKYICEVDSLTGKIKTEIIDTGCRVIVFDHKNKKWKHYDTKVIAECNKYDLAILSFISDQKLAIAKIADKNMLEQVRVFDEVFSIGCQLGRTPVPTVGIISQILTGIHGEKEWIIYGNTAQISPGSSGGGLFKKYAGKYYLIGIPYSILIAPNGQFIPHLSHAISISTARNFIDLDSVINP